MLRSAPRVWRTRRSRLCRTRTREESHSIVSSAPPRGIEREGNRCPPLFESVPEIGRAASDEFLDCLHDGLLGAALHGRRLRDDLHPRVSVSNTALSIKHTKERKKHTLADPLNVTTARRSSSPVVATIVRTACLTISSTLNPLDSDWSIIYGLMSGYARQTIRKNTNPLQAQAPQSTYSH